MFRSVVALVCLASFGCGTSPESMLIGAWTPDTQATKLPTMPLPGMDQQIKTGIATTLLKLRPDKTFLLAAGPRQVEGKWVLENRTVTLRPNRGSFEGPLAFFGTEIKAALAPNNQSMSLEQETPFGPAKLVMRKSG